MNKTLMSLSRMVQKSLRQGLFICGITLTFLMIAIGVSPIDSLKISIVVSVQWLSGSIIWSQFIRRGDSSTFEAIAIGAPIGFAVSVFSDQVFLPTLFHSVGWTFPHILIALFVMTSLEKPKTKTEYAELQQVFLLTITACLFGLGGIYFVYTAGALMMLIFVALMRSRNTLARQPSFVHLAVIASSVVIYFAVRLNKPQPTSILRPIFQDSDDHIFSEQMSWSLAHLGLFDNSSAIGAEIKYHWFSLAWSGLVTRASGVGPWNVNLVLVPIVTFLILSLIFVALVHKYWHLRWVVFLSPLLLLATDDPTTILRFYSNSATTNLLPHIWLAATAFVLIRFTSVHDWRFRSAVALLSAATGLGKGPSGVVLLGGLAGLLMYGIIFRRNRDVRPLIGTSVIATVAIVASYLLFINDSNNISYSPSWAQVKSLFPFPLLADVPDGSKFALPIGGLFFLTFLCRRFLIIFFCRRKSVFRTAPYWFVVGSSITGMLSFVLYNLGGTQYFLNAALTIGAMGTVYLLANDMEPLTISNFWKQNTKRNYLIGASVWMVLLFLLHQSRFILEQNFYSIKTFAYLIPLAVFIVNLALVLIQKRTMGTNEHTSYSRIAQMGIVIFTLATFISFTQRIDFSPTTPTKLEITEIASDGEIEALNWIDKNLPQFVILATNRSLCESSVSCSSQSGSHLVSAVSRRRVLLEGPRFIPSAVFSDGTYQTWALDRATASLEFISAPNQVNARQLVNYGVTDVYVSKNTQLPTIWEPWAKIIFENETSLVLHLMHLG